MLRETHIVTESDQGQMMPERVGEAVRGSERARYDRVSSTGIDSAALGHVLVGCKDSLGDLKAKSD